MQDINAGSLLVNSLDVQVIAGDNLHFGRDGELPVMGLDNVSYLQS